MTGHDHTFTFTKEFDGSVNIEMAESHRSKRLNLIPKNGVRGRSDPNVEQETQVMLSSRCARVAELADAPDSKIRWLEWWDGRDSNPQSRV